MTLKDLSLVEAKQFTSHYPALVVGANNAGKSFSIENMPAEDKKRTDIFNYDIKPLGEGTPDEFHNVYTVFADSTSIDKQLDNIVAIGTKLAAENKDNPILAKLREQREHLQKMKDNSFFIDDDEAIDKMVNKILESAFNPDVDRIVADTLTALTDFCDAWSKAHFSGREVWNAYGTAHQRILQALKEANIFCYKYVYILAHHEYIPPAQYAMTPKQVVKVKGGIMSGNVEAHFNTIVFTHATQEGIRMFECDVNSSLDTSRTKILDGKFSFNRTSLDDLEQLFAKKKTVVDGKLVEA